MCGIAGVISRDRKVEQSVLKGMTDAIAHRGPDGDGHWVNIRQNVGLAHRRLAIIDLSDAGKQPMFYANGRYSITLNGEIYNYLELRDWLESRGHRFVSTSDTEVLLALFAEKGEDCLNDIDGMFAFAIWDENKQRLFAARDRFGEKPFYWAIHDGGFYFASEMKALWSAGVPRVVSSAMLYNYLTQGVMYNPSDLTETFFEGIYKLKAAHYFFISPDSLKVAQTRYWTIRTDRINYGISEMDAEEEFRRLFNESVMRRLRSDVPVGSSLSGGLDSSLVVCSIDRLNADKNIRQATFSARFPGFAKDEGQYMQAVIDRTRVEPHFVYPDEHGLIENIEKLFHHQEEPFGSASIYAQYCVMQLAKEHGVTVLLDGQGADELLAGYISYFDDYLSELRSNDPDGWRRESEAYARLHSGGENGSGLKKALVQWLPSPVRMTAKRLRGRLQRPAPTYLNEDFRHENSNSVFAALPSAATLQNQLFRHATGGPLEELLRYADRNSMAHSREVRLPFLHTGLAEFLFSLPSDLKIRNGITKYVMRRAFRDILPAKILERTDKIGYEPPQGSWLKNVGMIERVASAADVLAGRNILRKNALQVVRGHEARSTIFSSHNWRILMAGNLFKS